MFNELLVSRFSNALNSLLGLQGGPGAPALGPEIIPTIVVENDPPEFQLLKNVRKFGAWFSETTGGATQVGIRLRNPATSNTIVTITRISWSATVAAEELILRIGRAAGSITGGEIGLAVSLDTRVPVATGSCLLYSSDVSAAPAVTGTLFYRDYADSGIAAAPIGALTQLRMDPIVLAPGGILELQHVQFSCTTRHDLMWYERPLAAGEQQL